MRIISGLEQVPCFFFYNVLLSFCSPSLYFFVGPVWSKQCTGNYYFIKDFARNTVISHSNSAIVNASVKLRPQLGKYTFNVIMSQFSRSFLSKLYFHCRRFLSLIRVVMQGWIIVYRETIYSMTQINIGVI